MTPTERKQWQIEHSRLMAEFRKRGGKIQRIPSGVLRDSSGLSMKEQNERIYAAKRGRASAKRINASGGGRKPLFECKFRGVSGSVNQHCIKHGLINSSVYRLIQDGMKPEQALETVAGRVIRRRAAA